MRFRDRFARFMYGRNGTDDLNRFLMIVELVFFVLGVIFGMFTSWGGIFYYLVILVIILMYFRMFSKNIAKRRKENETYLRVKYKVTQFFNEKRRGGASRTNRSSGSGFGRRKRSEINYDSMFRIYKCPTCGQKIRVPRGKGKIQITCPKCRGQFIKRT